MIQNSFHKLDESSQAKILEEITAAIAAFVRSENNDNDATDGISDTAESVQKYFKKLVGFFNYKKPSVRALAKILTLLLNKKSLPSIKLEK